MPLVSAKSPKRSNTVITTLVVGFFIIAIPFGVFIYQLFQAIQQNHINRTYTPVEATILSADVSTHYGSKGHVYYMADISYRYVADGTSYVSEKVTPIDSHYTLKGAQSVIARFKRGQVCQAFRDPDDPSHAVLIKRYDVGPYFLMLLMVPITTMGCFVLMRSLYQLPRISVPANNGWFEIKPTLGERDRLRIAVACSVAWYFLIAIVAFHHFSAVPAPYLTRMTSLFTIFATIGLIPIGFIIRYFLINRNFNEARVTIDKPQAFLGQPLQFSISQSAHHQLDLQEVLVQLRCIEIRGQGKYQSRSVVYTGTALDLKNQKVLLGQPLNLTGEITLPSDQRPSGRQESKTYIWINWEINMRCKIALAPDYECSFPIPVDEAQSDSSIALQNPSAINDTF